MIDPFHAFRIALSLCIGGYAIIVGITDAMAGDWSGAGWSIAVGLIIAHGFALGAVEALKQSEERRGGEE